MYLYTRPSYGEAGRGVWSFTTLFHEIWMTGVKKRPGTKLSLKEIKPNYERGLISFCPHLNRK